MAYCLARDTDTITVPENTKSIGPYAFDQCSATRIILPEGVTFIGRSAFALCRKLESINLPDSLAFLDDFAFFGCRALQGLSLPSALKQMGRNPFASCIGLKGLSFRGKNDVFFLADGALYNQRDKVLVTLLATSQAKEFSIAEGTVAIDGHAFSHCSQLQRIFVPDSVVSLAFEQCADLVEVKLPAALKEIDRYWSFGCTSMRYTFPEEK